MRKHPLHVSTSCFVHAPLPSSCSLQGVMLSLMSHLAHAMGKDTTLRLQWMTEVATCVDPHDEHTGPYLR